MKLTAAILITVLAILPTANGALAQEEEEYMRMPYRVAITLDGGLGTASLPAPFKDWWNESLPASATFGVSVMSWLEVGGFFTYVRWGISGIPAKKAIGFIGVAEVTGGSKQTLLFGGVAKILPLPNHRLAPFVEVGGGYFKASADNLQIAEGFIINNEMDDVSGPLFVSSLGTEYNLSTNWNVYTKFNWTIGFNKDFNPENLLRARGDPPANTGGNMQFGSLVLGIKFKV
jgi:opacity protein-like surface antigen